MEKTMEAEVALKLYESRINNHRFEDVESLISEKAVFWFTDGEFTGIDEIREAFESTWQNLNNDTYWLTDIEWLAGGEELAVCTYRFNWKTEIDGQERTGSGRGTTVLGKEGGDWKILHEHLSPLPVNQ